MNKFTKYSLFSMALLAGMAAFTACSSDEVAVEDTAPVNPTYNGETVKTEFAINIPHAHTNKRMTSDNTQNTASSGSNNFLGMEGINLIPLNIANPGTAGTVTGSEGISSIIRLSNITASFGGTGDGESGPSDNEGQKIYSDVEIPTGTNTFLFYGQALYKTSPAYSTEAEKYFAQGALETSLDDGSISTVNNITFNLKQILTNRGDLTTPQNALLDQLNDVVTAFGSISTSNDNAEQETLYQLFTSLKDLKAGSANAVKATMEMLYNAVAKIASGTSLSTGDAVYIAQKVLEAIATDATGSDVTEAPLFKATADGTTGEYTLSWRDGVSEDIQKFPTNLYLPEGAMQVEWSTDKFAYQTQSSNSGSGVTVGADGNLVSLNSLTYPASLAYYACSTVKANDNATASFPKAGQWETTDGSIAQPWTGWDDAVQATSRLVALAKNVDYAVASLKTTVQFGKQNVEDNRSQVVTGQQNNIITIGNETFQLTGILIGGQPSEAAYNFQPTEDAEATQTVYDNLEMANDAATTPINVTTTAMPAPIYTLVLDNKGMGSNNQDAETVNFALELKNNSGVAFYGQGGIVENGMKFYLVGTLNKNAGSGVTSPTDVTSPYIFMQDYMTTATVTINSLKNAYVTIPDLRATNLKLGLSVDLKWEEGYKFDVSIN